MKIKIENTIINYSSLDDLNNQLRKFNSSVGEYTELGENISLKKGVVIGIGVKLSDNINLSENVIIEDECIIGKSTIVESDTLIQTGVKVGDNVRIGKNLIVGEEAIIDNNVYLEKTFYKKTFKSNITYCGNNKVSIGCQLLNIDSWMSKYELVANRFKYSKEEIEECLIHMNYIKEQIND